MRHTTTNITNAAADRVMIIMAENLQGLAAKAEQRQFTRLHIAPAIAPVRPDLQGLLSRAAIQARPFTPRRKTSVLQSIINPQQA